ncbi:MAG: AAA domain-containing protein [Ruminococcaceae bacterium]|nr:AAA domain-containing protein [Oscillospiraceae bacterium]
MEQVYDWVPFYEELANKLLEYKDNRQGLVDKVLKIFKNTDIRLPSLEKDNKIFDIDPFTFFGLFNKTKMIMSDKNKIVSEVADLFDIKSPLPTSFDGIPTVLPFKARYYPFMDKRVETDIDNLWGLFESALAYASNSSPQNRKMFSNYFNLSIKVDDNGNVKITSGLFWISPDSFLALDGNNKKYIYSSGELPESLVKTLPKIEDNKKIPAEDYLDILDKMQDYINSDESTIKDFKELSSEAWKLSQEAKEKNNKVEKDTRETTSLSDISEDSETVNDNHDLSDNSKFPKNLILFGSPGTGKTYSSIQYAVAIIENKRVEEVKTENYEKVFSRYQKYKEDGLIAFTTFHQSYGYEEFVEGIRPVISIEDDSEYSGEIEYEIHVGIFKAFCDRAGTPVGEDKNIDLGIEKNPTVWKVSLEGTGDNKTRAECFANGHIRIGYDEHGETIPKLKKGVRGRRALNSFYYKMQIGDIVMSCYSSRTIDAIGVITGDPEWHNEYSEYKRLRKVNWLVTGINEDIYELNSEKDMSQDVVHELTITISDVLQLLKKVKSGLFSSKSKNPFNHVFIIDEINRGNISKVFGELITLIEGTKRIGAKEELRVTLPYSKQIFGVPDNVYIIGTMNTADRSIAIIDVALRRRFKFIEMLPDSSILEDIVVDGIDIAKMLDTLNKRITILLDRDHTLGHSYFLKLKDNPSIEHLADIFQYEIIPQLQEYFYDDYEKIRLVLGDNAKDESTQFIVKRSDSREQFANKGSDFDFSPEYYEINTEAFKKVEAYEYLK